MPANKNALIRYKTIDRCLSNHYRRWTLEDLVDACCMALNEYEGISKGVSVRTVQGDIQMMRSDKLGYNAPIEVYDHKYYRYADPNYRITEMPFSPNDVELLSNAVEMLSQLGDFEQFSEMADVVSRLQDMVSATVHGRTPIVHYDRVADLKGLKLLSPLYEHIAQKQPLSIKYQSFSALKPHDYIVHPYLLKEFRNRWFLFCSQDKNMRILNLALDRMLEIDIATGVTFRDNNRFDINHYFDDLIGVSKTWRDKPQEVTFWANKEQSNYIKTKPLHQSQTIVKENEEDGSCIFSISVVINIEMYSVFMSYGPGIKILSPQKVVNFIRWQLQKAANQYE